MTPVQIAAETHMDAMARALVLTGRRFMTGRATREDVQAASTALLNAMHDYAMEIDPDAEPVQVGLRLVANT